MVKIRPAILDDLAFIYATWLKSYRYSSQFAKKLSNEVYYDMHHRAIDAFINRGGIVLIAHAEDDPQVIIGYICFEPHGNILHYIYVKKPFRKMGVGTNLLEASKLPTNAVFTHWTSDTNWITKKLTDLIYNPYLL